MTIIASICGIALIVVVLWEGFGGAEDRRLLELRCTYEPYLYALGRYFRVSVPPWIAEAHYTDNWQSISWEEGVAARMPGEGGREHF